MTCTRPDMDPVGSVFIEISGVNQLVKQDSSCCECSCTGRNWQSPDCCYAALQLSNLRGKSPKIYTTKIIGQFDYEL